MNLQEFKKKQMRNPKFRAEYNKYDLAFEVSQMLIEARIVKGVTQARLAEMARTKQAGIARAESGKSLPTLSFLKRIADAFNTYLLPPRFAFLVNPKMEVNLKSTQATLESKKETATITERQDLGCKIQTGSNTDSFETPYQYQYAYLEEGGSRA